MILYFKFQKLILTYYIHIPFQRREQRAPRVAVRRRRPQDGSQTISTGRSSAEVHKHVSMRSNLQWSFKFTCIWTISGISDGDPYFSNCQNVSLLLQIRILNELLCVHIYWTQKKRNKVVYCIIDLSGLHDLHETYTSGYYEGDKNQYGREGIFENNE